MITSRVSVGAEPKNLLSCINATQDISIIAIAAQKTTARNIVKSILPS
jgi:hypothetical protein